MSGAAADAGCVLVIGYGNTLRRDDGVGVRAAELLAADPRLGGVEVEARHQLTPELALDISAASLVIFVDADVRGLPGSVEVRPVEVSAERSDVGVPAEPGASSHHVGAADLVALAAVLDGHTPEAVIIGIGISDMEFGEVLTPAVEASLPRVVELVVDLIADYRAR